MKNNYYVIGLPVDHSLSPLLHSNLYEIYGISGCEYGSFNVAPGRLKNFIDFIPQQNIRGFNITMPLKTEILPFLKYRDESVYNGANTVVVNKDGLYGYSTDAIGFRKSLAMHGRDYTSKTIVFLGSGAVAQTLVHDAVIQKASQIFVLNRTVEKAAALADGKTVFADSLDRIADYMPDCDLLINTTPLGMDGIADNFADLSFLGRLKFSAFVCDLIYRPFKTDLLREAERLKIPYMNGLGMLIWQAFYAFEKFLGILPGPDQYVQIEAALTDAL